MASGEIRSSINSKAAHEGGFVSIDLTYVLVFYNLLRHQCVFISRLQYVHAISQRAVRLNNQLVQSLSHRHFLLVHHRAFQVQYTYLDISGLLCSIAYAKTVVERIWLNGK